MRKVLEYFSGIESFRIANGSHLEDHGFFARTFGGGSKNTSVNGSSISRDVAGPFEVIGKSRTDYQTYYMHVADYPE